MKNKIRNPSMRATPWDKKDNPLPIETFIRSNYLEYFKHHHERNIEIMSVDFEETIIVSRKNEKNIVLINLDKYTQLEKAARNNEYLAMIDRGIAQLEAGKGQEHELVEVD